MRFGTQFYAIGTAFLICVAVTSATASSRSETVLLRHRDLQHTVTCQTPVGENKLVLSSVEGRPGYKILRARPDTSHVWTVLASLTVPDGAVVGDCLLAQGKLWIATEASISDRHSFVGVGVVALDDQRSLPNTAEPASADDGNDDDSGSGSGGGSGGGNGGDVLDIDDTGGNGGGYCDLTTADNNEPWVQLHFFDEILCVEWVQSDTLIGISRFDVKLGVWAPATFWPAESDPTAKRSLVRGVCAAQ